MTILATSTLLRAGMMTDSCATKRRQNTPLVAISNTCVFSSIVSFLSQKFQFAPCDSSQSSPMMTSWICSDTSRTMVLVLPPSLALTVTVPMTDILVPFAANSLMSLYRKWYPFTTGAGNKVTSFPASSKETRCCRPIPNSIYASFHLFRSARLVTTNAPCTASSVVLARLEGQSLARCPGCWHS